MPKVLEPLDILKLRPIKYNRFVEQVYSTPLARKHPLQFDFLRYTKVFLFVLSIILYDIIFSILLSRLVEKVVALIPPVIPEDSQ